MLSGANTFTGGDTVTTGTLSVGADTNLGDAANTVTLNGGTLATTATFASARAVTLGGGVLSPNAATTLTLSGVLSGAGGLTLNGAGTLVLGGANTFTGGATITAGTLSVSADTNLGDAANALTLNGGHAGEHRDVHLGPGGDARRRRAEPERRDDADAVGGVERRRVGSTLNGAGTLVLTARTPSPAG